MKNKYIKLYMNQHNEFRTYASLALFGTQFTNVNVKIDTGCGATTILASKLGIPKIEAQKLKRQDCYNPSIGKAISFGVNDSKKFREEAKIAFREKQFENLPCISNGTEDPERFLTLTEIEELWGKSSKKYDGIKLSVKRKFAILIWEDFR